MDEVGRSNVSNRKLDFDPIIGITYKVKTKAALCTSLSTT
jgi:hypothetical protein